MSLLFKVPPGRGHHKVFGIGEQGIRWLGLDVLRLKAGESWSGAVGADAEAALVVMSGRAAVAVGGGRGERWEGLGGRPDMFAGPGHTVYAPRASALEVQAETALELAIARAPCDTDLPARLVPPGEVKVVSAGMASWRRDVRLLIPPGSPISQRLIVGETINPPGNWSGIPPHKHDVISENENILEEFYYFHTRPADGYGVQLLTVDGQERAHVLHAGDVAVLRNGYHPTCAAPGVTVGYLWVLSGDNKAYDITIDTRFAWVPQAEAVLRELAQR